MQTKESSIDIFLLHGGILRMSEAIKLGISRYMLYSLEIKGIITHMSRGLYRLVNLPPISNPDLATVSLRFPNSVICLISALSFHEITTQIPHTVSLAVSRNSRIPVLDQPPITVHRFSAESFKAGIDVYHMDGIPVNIYTPEKAIADCFKFRNKIGMDIVLEALKMYKSRKKINLDKILHYAGICRVEKIILPYLEMMQ
jgi:predicted transcriptional regulator of viral defense system